MEPIRILGGGLSGLATAVLLARQGRRVEVRDRRPHAGGRFGGGFQVLENGSSRVDALDELEGLGLRPECELVPLRSALLLDHRMRRFEVASAEPYAYLLRRGAGPGTLDGWLLGEAEAAGVRLEHGAGADDGWQPEVVATGPRRADGVARELVFRTDHPDLIVVLFDPRLTPTGYSYLFVNDGVGTLGAAVVRGHQALRGIAREAFARLRAEFPMRTEALGEKTLFMNFGLPHHLHDGHRWYVGEAAGVQDFLFGLGNRLALRSAALVARALAGGRWDDQAFRATIRRPMVATVLLRVLYEIAGRGTMDRLCRWLAAGDFRDRLQRLQRPARWRCWLARPVMAAWGDRGGCPHLPVATWCRRRDEA
jgi:flavin-dependent dehydrogenase